MLSYKFFGFVLGVFSSKSQSMGSAEQAAVGMSSPDRCLWGLSKGQPETTQLLKINLTSDSIFRGFLLSFTKMEQME